MSKPAEAWYPYIRNIAYRYPHNRHPEEDAALKAALEAIEPEEREMIELVYLRRTKTMQEAANLCFVSYSTAHRINRKFLREVAKNLKLPMQ